MNLSTTIAELDKNCERCKIRQAASLLREIQEDLAPLHPMDDRAPAETAPIRTSVTICNEPSRSVSNPPYATSKSVRSADGKSKKCHRCGKMKLVDEFTVNRKCHGGRSGECLLCARERAKRNYYGRQARKKAAQSTQPEITAPGAQGHGPDSAPKVPESQKRFACLAPGCGRKFATKYIFDEHRRMRHGAA